MIQEKPCKGQGKGKSAKGCGKMVDVKYRKYGLCSTCYADFILNTDYGKILLEKATLKATKPRRELKKAEKLVKESRRLPEAIRQTQIIFNRYIRMRDRFMPCISSGNSWKPDDEAGHLFSVKQYNELRFDENNCHGQSLQDNRFKEGNFEEYIIRLSERIGQDNFQKLLLRAEKAKQRTYKWTLEELAIIRSTYKTKIKELKQ